MADIFISYSSKDREQADLLTELLASAGLSVWIDKSGIEVSTSWSKEIVQAINECHAFIVLLSPNSIVSNNVIKEVSLASEKRKKILPLDLEPVQLTEDFEYQLAGIQRAPMTNIDAVIRALGKLGLEATHAPTIQLVKETDARKSLMILPFEDLSPTGDNAWFADGIVSEMISALSNVKSLRVADQQATKDYKRYQGTLPTYAREMNIRYFVQGDVRKFGDNIKITSRLLDIESGNHLWQDSMKGTMDDIFEIQESVAEKVVAGLTIHLSDEEKAKVSDRGTQNAEAYEYYMLARSYYALTTKQSLEHSIDFCKRAIALDPDYWYAHSELVHASVSYFRAYSRDAMILERADIAVGEVERLQPESASLHTLKAILLATRGKIEEAIDEAKKSIAIDPASKSANDTLGYIYLSNNRAAEAAKAYEDCLRLEPDRLTYHFNVTAQYDRLGEVEKAHSSAKRALPYYKKHIDRHPDDTNNRTNYSVMLLLSGRETEAKNEIDYLLSIPGIDARCCVNCGFALIKIGENNKGFDVLEKAIILGFPPLKELLQEVTFDHLRNEQRYKELVILAESRSANIEESL